VVTDDGGDGGGDGGNDDGLVKHKTAVHQLQTEIVSDKFYGQHWRHVVLFTNFTDRLCL